MEGTGCTRVGWPAWCARPCPCWGFICASPSSSSSSAGATAGLAMVIASEPSKAGLQVARNGACSAAGDVDDRGRAAVRGTFPKQLSWASCCGGAGQSLARFCEPAAFLPACPPALQRDTSQHGTLSERVATAYPRYLSLLQQGGYGWYPSKGEAAQCSSAGESYLAAVASAYWVIGLKLLRCSMHVTTQHYGQCEFDLCSGRELSYYNCTHHQDQHRLLELKLHLDSYLLTMASAGASPLSPSCLGSAQSA